MRRFSKIGAGFVCDAKRHMRARCYARDAFDVLELIIEEDVRLNFLEHAVFGNSPQKKYFIHFDSPLPQCGDDSFMCRRIPCRYDHRSKAWAVSRVFLFPLTLELLKITDLSEEPCKRTFFQWLQCLLHFPRCIW
jgi:hypothetical protein